MNLTVGKKDLLHLAARALGIADRKSTMPVLSMLLLDAKGDQLVVSATDLYRSLVDRTAAEVAKSGSVAVEVKSFVDRVKTLPDGPVTLTASDRSLVLKSKVSARKFTLPMLPGEDYPPIAQPDPEAARISMDAAALARIVALTSFSISHDTGRAHLNCALLEWSGTTIRMVSSDGHRLSKAEITVEGQTEARMLIPQSGIPLIESLAEAARGTTEENAGKLQIVPSGSTAFFVTGNATFGVKLTDAEFPPWQQVIPSGPGEPLRIGRAVLLDAFRAVSLAAADREGAVKISVDAGKMLLTSESPLAGDGADELSVEYGGKKFTTGVNAKYVIEALSALDCEEVSIGLLGELDPLLLRPVEANGVDFLGVIMPVRI